jgi:hypothetical protein
MGVFASECEDIAKRTPDKEWHRRLKTIQTLSMKIFDERLEAVEPKQKESVLRRYKHTSIKFFTSDQNRIKCKDDGKPEEEVNIAHSDLFDLLDLCAYNCKACPQGDCREQCYYRELYHRLGVPVSREEPKDGECEFGYNSVGEVDSPKHHLLRIKEERERI